MEPTVSAVVVAFGNPSAVRRTVQALAEQSLAPLEILLVDNHPSADTAAATAGWDLPVVLVASGENLGFAAGCNIAARVAAGDWLFFCNPDSAPAPDCLAELASAIDKDTAVVGAQVLLEDGKTNAGDNPVHISGLAWSGRYGQPAETGEPRDAASVSGAALMARRDDFLGHDGFCEAFFMYYEDVDLCWRMRMAGRRVRFAPRAMVVHDYSFAKGTEKFFLLERNRGYAQLANLSRPGLLLLAPVLLATEAGMVLVAMREHWLGRKAAAWAALWRGRRERREWRAKVQSRRRVGDSVLLAGHTGRLDTPLVHIPGRGPLGALLEGYRRVVVAVLPRGAA